MASPGSTDPARFLRALNRAAAESSAATSAAEVYPAAVSALAGLGFQANVYELHADGCASLRAASFEPSMVDRIEELTGLSRRSFRFPIANSALFDRVMARGETVFIEAAADVLVDFMPGRSRQVASAVARILGIGRVTAAPVMVGAEIRGMLVLLADELTVDDVPAVEAFARLLGQTIERLELVETLAANMAALESAQAQLLHAQRLETIGRLTAGIAHDVNNLLTPSYFAVDMLRPHVAAGGIRWLDMVADTVQRTARLTQQLLALGRRQQLQVEVLDLNEALGEMEGLLCRVLGAGVQCEADLAARRAWVRGDRAQLEQVLLNLVVNARDAVRAGGSVRWSTDDDQAVLPGRDEPRPCVRLDVIDDGVGMDAAQLAHAFEPFFTTKDSGHGSGLGLAVVEGIVVQHGGRIVLSSEPGHGTRASVWLPLTDQAPAPAGHRADATLPVLDVDLWLVEDHPQVRVAVASVLRQQGARVAEATSLDQARQLLEGAPPPAAVLCDIVLPDGEGIDFVAALAEVSPQTRVLFVSGHPLTDAQARRVAALGHAYLPKPFTPARVTRALRDLLDSPD